MSTSILLSAHLIVSIVGAGDRFFAGEKPVPTIDAIGAPEPIVARIREIETELKPMAGRLTFFWSSTPADLLFVTTLDSSAAVPHFKEAIAAYTSLRSMILPSVESPSPPSDPNDSTPWQPITLTAPTTVVHLGEASSIRLETSPVQNRSREPIPGALFDVECTQMQTVIPDADDVRPGYQLKTDADGVLSVPLTPPKVTQAHIARMRVTAVANPRVTAELELHLTFSNSPHFLTVFLVRDSEEEYFAVLDYLVRLYPQGNAWASRPDDAKQSAKKRSAYFFAYPESIVLPDRAHAKKDEKWVTKNQIVHEIAHPVLYEYFGPLPHWLEEGIAWDLEDSLTHSVRAFCGFEGFVYDADNVGWMQKLHGVESPADLKLVDVFDYHGEATSKRPNGTKGESTFDVIKYAKSLAVVRCLEANPSRTKFPKFLDAVANEWRSKGQIGGARQLEILKEQFGGNVEASIVAYIKQQLGGGGSR
ncbi:MAG: hypothetical protein HYR85_25530 [Planctomycetes bacterium]|nr:hypothetical protein [Planctomycetota bacterium]